jgi:hypothetical protein
MTVKQIKQRVTRNKKEIIAWIKMSGSVPKQNSANVLEKRLGMLLHAYVSRTSDSYDKKFRILVHGKESRLRLKSNPEKSKKLILKWAEKHGRLPKYNSTGAIESSYGHRLENYLSTKGISFDPEFRKLIYSKFPRKVNNKREHNKKLRMKELVAFLEANNRAPSKFIKEERLLCSVLYNYASPTSPLYNASLERKVYKFDPCYHTTIAKKYRRSINEALSEAESKLKEEGF